jgi:drug/metabolite transporter (DMT)-like permease
MTMMTMIGARMRRRTRKKALFTRGSRSVPAAELGLIALAEPVLAPIWVWLAFGETTPVPVIIGGAIIMGAIVVQTLGGLRRG